MRIFISYGEPDRIFAESLGAALSRTGVEVFLFSGNAPAGKKLHHVMRDGISEADYVLLICSEASLDRPGVANEIEEALQKEARNGGALVLVPLTLDDYVFRRWCPPHAGTAQALRDHAIVDFRGLKPNTSKFNRKVLDVRDSLHKQSPASIRRVSSIKVHSVIYDVNVLDSSGNAVDVTYIQKFESLENNSYLNIPNITASGTIDFINCNMASKVRTEEFGGQQRLVMKSNLPLTIGKMYLLKAEFKAINSYTLPTESASIMPTDNVDTISFKISLPESRLATACRLYRIIGDDRVQLPGRYRFSSGQALRASVNSPVSCAHYVLQWDW